MSGLRPCRSDTIAIPASRKNAVPMRTVLGTAKPARETELRGDASGC